MPNRIKIIISLLVAAAATGLFLHERAAGHAASPWIAIALAVFMVVALWIFPEAKGQKQKGER